MKFKSVLFSLLLLILLISCTPIDKKQIENQEVGAWGPIILQTKNASDSYFLINKKYPGNKIEVRDNIVNDHHFLYPLAPLALGSLYQLKINNNDASILDNIYVRKPCVIYISNPNGQSEIWKKCQGGNPEQITKTGGKVQSFTTSWLGDKIFFASANETNSIDIWQIKPDGSEANNIFKCLDSECTDLKYSPLTGMLAFIQTNNVQQIKLINLNDQSITNIENSASGLNFSPDGQYLSFLNSSSNELKIIDLSNMSQVVQPSSAGLIGGWSKDSKSILFGQLNYWGGIPDMNVYRFEVKSGELNPLFSSQNQELEYSQPTFTGDPGIYLASVRQSNTGSNRQFWLLNSKGEAVKEITTDPLYHYSFPSWNSDYSELMFQRYPINTSSGAPQVVIWNKSTDSFVVVVNNATSAFWLP
jgi:dipeptidyl aminopeptidase/acylaminoacyl peptidase